MPILTTLGGGGWRDIVIWQYVDVPNTCRDYIKVAYKYTAQKPKETLKYMKGTLK